MIFILLYFSGSVLHHEFELIPCAFVFADLEMSFDPTKLLANIHYKAKVPQPSKGKKRAREVAPKMAPISESSTLPKGKTSTSRGSTSTPQSIPTRQAWESRYRGDLEVVDDGLELIPTSALED